MKNKLAFLTLAVSLTPFMSTAQPVTFGNPEAGTISIGGNAELNINFRDHETPSARGNTENEIDQDGRLLIEFAGEKSLDNNYYINFKAQPLINTTGKVTVDDAYLEFGKKSNWLVKTGRFEAFDMFPKTGDVFLEYSGDTSNSLYQNASSYSYQLAEARGRGSDGQVMVSKSIDNLYLELNLLLGDRSGLFSNERYHNLVIANSKDTIVARPVVSYQFNDFNFALAAETNLISDAVVGKIDSKDPNEIDISDRTGYAAKVTWNNSEYVANLMYTYLDAVNETNQTIGLTGGWRDIVGLGYIHSFNEYSDAAWRVGDIDVTTFYASYAFRNVLSIQGFSVLLGSYYSHLHNDLSFSAVEPIAENGDAGARLRLHYNF